ncbi:hypothetical protein H5410_061724 [Solanum commersonii]|uniref:Uncharacterized protein n=1 Tax=Solanum commersonii TaxID=4109 RepID=A0A9J5WAG7_SOLCO|nr:hypothetical protein H5410_061724 [Solanum commersonii]
MINDAFGVQESSRPLCEGSPHFALSVAVRLMKIKSDWNVPNAAMDSMVDPLGELVNQEFNIPKNFYQAKRNSPNHNDEGNIDLSFPPISIFNQNSRGSKKCGMRGFTDMEMQSVVTHIFHE